MNSTLSTTRVKKLKRLCSVHGVPKHFVTNRPASRRIKSIHDRQWHWTHKASPIPFCQKCICRVLRVQILKKALRATTTEKKPPSWKLANFLLSYRKTPHAMIGGLPSMFLTRRKHRTRLVARKPRLDSLCYSKSESQRIQLGDNTLINSQSLLQLRTPTWETLCYNLT